MKETEGNHVKAQAFSCAEIHENLDAENSAFNLDDNNVLSLSLSPDIMEKQWECIGRLSDAIAGQYVAPAGDKRKFIQVSTILNELIENAVSYSHKKDSPVQIDVWPRDNRLYIKITNEVSKKEWTLLKELFDDLFAADLKSKYVKKIKDYKEGRGSTGLGLFLLRKDFNTRLSLSVFEDDEDRMWVSVTADVKLS